MTDAKPTNSSVSNAIGCCSSRPETSGVYPRSSPSLGDRLGHKARRPNGDHGRRTGRWGEDQANSEGAIGRTSTAAVHGCPHDHHDHYGNTDRGDRRRRSLRDQDCSRSQPPENSADHRTDQGGSLPVDDRTCHVSRGVVCAVVEPVATARIDPASHVSRSTNEIPHSRPTYGTHMRDVFTARGIDIRGLIRHRPQPWCQSRHWRGLPSQLRRFTTSNRAPSGWQNGAYRAVVDGWPAQPVRP